MMDIQMDALLDRLSQIAGQSEDGNLSAEQARMLIELLNDLSDQLEISMELIARQQAQMARAIRLYKRYNSWPAPLDPDPTRVMDWLLDVHAGRKQAVELRETIHAIYARLQELGDLDFSSEYAVRGSYLIGLRIVVKNALTLFRIDAAAKPEEKPAAPPIRILP